MAKRKVTNGSQVKGKNGKGSAPILDEDGFEILGGASGELKIGEVVEGVFGGVVRELESIQKGKPGVPLYQIGARVVLGSTVLRNRIEDGGVDVGDTLKVTRLEDAKSKKKGFNDTKIFDVRVKRAH